MRFLPWLLATLTGVPRYLPDIEWSDNSWTHNVFRFYELIFWRREGIRCESVASSTFDENGRAFVNVKLYTFEALCAHVETQVRQLARLPFRLVIKQLVPVGPSPFMFAIALDTNAAAGDGIASFSYTCTGSNRALLVGYGCFSGNGTAAAVYNSVTGTVINHCQPTGGNVNLSYVNNPSTGSNTLSVGGTAADFCIEAASYTGCAQNSSLVDSQASLVASDTFTISTTVVAATSWLIAVGFGFDWNAIAPSRTLRNKTLNSAHNFWVALADSNGTVAAGSQGITFTRTGGFADGSGGVIASLAIFTAAAAPTRRIFPGIAR